MIQTAIVKLQRNPKLKRVYAGTYRGYTRVVETTEDPHTMFLLTQNKSNSEDRMRTTLIDGAIYINEPYLPLERWKLSQIVEGSPMLFVIYYGRGADGTLFKRIQVKIPRDWYVPESLYVHTEAFFRLSALPSLSELHKNIILNDDLIKCDFDGIPAMRVWFDNGTLRCLMYYNGNGEVHRAGTDPAIVFFYYDGVVSSEMYIQHNRYFREGGLPSYAHYMHGTDVAYEQHHWTHAYGDEPPEVLPLLPSATLTDICPICFEDDRADVGVSLPSCTHLFHRDCMEAWMGKQRTCPVCRASVA